MNDKQKEYLKSFRIEDGNITAFMSIDEIYDLYEQLQRLAWMPIESAPRDGTMLLLIAQSGYSNTPYRFFAGYYCTSKGWVTFDYERSTYSGSDPTQWMPLPPTPKDD